VTFCKYKVSISYSQFALTAILRIGTSSDCHGPQTKTVLLTPDCMSVVHNFIHPIVPTASPVQQNPSRVLELKRYAASIHSSGTYICVDRLHVSLLLKVCLFYVEITPTNKDVLIKRETLFVSWNSFSYTFLTVIFIRIIV
jgi:hypothetical protein